MTSTEQAIAGMEPVCADVGAVVESLGEAATISIAISLKRIADSFAPVNGTDIGLTLFYMVQRLGSQS